MQTSQLMVEDGVHITVIVRPADVWMTGVYITVARTYCVRTADAIFLRCACMNRARTRVCVQEEARSDSAIIHTAVEYVVAECVWRAYGNCAITGYDAMPLAYLYIYTHGNKYYYVFCMHIHLIILSKLTV